MRTQKLSPRAEGLLAAALLVVALVLLIAFFEQFPIEGTSLGLDWESLWAGVKGGNLRYDQGVRSPPWSVWPLLPLGWLSFRASWGVLTLATIIVLILCVPRHTTRAKRWLAVALLLLSFPSLRHMVDGNLEGLVIGGILLIGYGYNQRQVAALTLGLLLATAKPQETWWIVLIVGFGVIKHWPPAQWLKLAGLTGTVVIASLLWKGSEWWPSMADSPFKNTIIDISLPAAIDRLGWPGSLTLLSAGLVAGLTLWVSLKNTSELSRSKIALLACASMLISPYAAGNSFLTVLAIGIIPLFLSRPWLGGFLILLTNLPYLANYDLLFYGQAYYWTILLLIAWGVFAWQVGWEPGVRQPAQPA